jgi:hypothetical protein
MSNSVEAVWVRREKKSPGTTSEERLCAEARGALQVLHLGTCYSLRGYPGRPSTLQPRELLVNRRYAEPFARRLRY